MPTLYFLTRQRDGSLTPQDIEAEVGQTVMQAALAAHIDGIAADCGGMLTCATCHVYVTSEWAARLPPPAAEELEMLNFAAAEQRETSRLSCQIKVGPETDGLMLELPSRQY